LIASIDTLPARYNSDNRRHDLGEVLVSMGFGNRKITQWWKTTLRETIIFIWLGIMGFASLHQSLEIGFHKTKGAPPGAPFVFRGQ
jgi:hypothetical protein